MRLAMLGCGAVARKHAGRLRRHRREVSLAFASRDRARADALAGKFGGLAFGSYDEAIASPEVDAVAVLTPPHLHLELTLAALAAGKHVLVEKPPFPRAADFDTVAAAAAAAGRHVFVAENYYYKPSLARLRQLLADGVVGDVLFVHVNAIKRQTTGAGDWRDDPSLTLGGALYEGGIHWVDFMANLGMEVTRVHGFRPTPPAAAGPGALERSMMLGFDYAEGAVGMLTTSWEVPSTAKGLRLSKIYGRAGTITFESNGLWILVHGKKTRFYVPGLRDLSGYHRMFADFVRAWRAGTEPELTLARARRDLAIVEAAYASAGTGVEIA
ncbi:MAG: Gfo/Idh/MocA family oxidoreductase [Kofleriaceae bacterium]|nr:Gfo/Idh/MocA family oxidoreductase [Myxococcales bacterium]MCB9560518.1 Gfo/Idh/MocA family oxidoreductase [Kofleriaceae bacterium]